MTDLFQRYADAWGRRDPDAIVALHTEDTTFHAHIGKSRPAAKRRCGKRSPTCSPSSPTAGSNRSH